MGGILYECRFHYNILLFAPLIMLVVCILLLIFQSRKLKKEGALALGIKIVKIFYLGGIIFLCIINILGIWFRIDLYNKTVVAYRNGDYQVVEGYVDNFEPMGSGGLPPEKFEIKGVKFEYSRNRIVSGYHKAKGDCTIRSGQHLKIGYVYYDKDYGNIIVYIEQLPYD